VGKKRSLWFLNHFVIRTKHTNTLRGQEA